MECNWSQPVEKNKNMKSCAANQRTDFTSIYCSPTYRVQIINLENKNLAYPLEGSQKSFPWKESGRAAVLSSVPWPFLQTAQRMSCISLCAWVRTVIAVGAVAIFVGYHGDKAVTFLDRHFKPNTYIRIMISTSTINDWPPIAFIKSTPAAMPSSS